MWIILTSLWTLRKPKPSDTSTTNEITPLEVPLLPWSASFSVAVILFPSIVQASSPLQFEFLCSLSIVFTLHASISIGVYAASSFSSFSILSPPYSRPSPYDTVFFADRPVENCQSTYTVTVTVVPSPYLDRLLTAVRRLRYGMQP
jgi:hypothetical protein